MKIKYIFFFLFGVVHLTPSFAQLRGFVRGVNLSDTLALNGAKIKLLQAKRPRLVIRKASSNYI